MKKSTLLISLATAIAFGAPAAGAENAAPIMSASTGSTQAYSVAVYARDARGATTLVGEKVTRGEPLTFGEEFSYLVGTDSGPRDAYNGHWSMRISGVRAAVADSESFDVSLEGRDPGVWEGRIDLHIDTGTGSRTGVVHWVDGKDYLIDIHPLAS